MKHITRKNFYKLFPEFLQDLHECSYVAIDLEFTGIDRTTTVDFFRLPEEAFEKKIEAACRFCPVQIGFSFFSGDIASENDVVVGRPAKASTDVASETYRAVMRQQAETFCLVEPETQAIKSLLTEMATSGSVTGEQMEKMFRERAKVEDACKNNLPEQTIYDQLRAYHILDEIDRAIEVATEWRKSIAIGNRHLFVKSYSCYLFPAPCGGAKDRDVTLLAETAEFLRKNNMDLNAWVSEGLHFVSFEEYAGGRQAAMSNAGDSIRTSSVEAKLNALRQWIQSLEDPEAKLGLLNEYNRIKDFVTTLDRGDRMEWRGPFLKQPMLGLFENHLRELGLRCTRRIMMRQSVLFAEDGDEKDSCKECSYHATRLLGALIDATRQKKKTLVIHNGLSDLAFLCSITRADVPRELDKFKSVVRDMFPVFYDTRALTCAPSLQHITGLTGPLKKTFAALYKKNTNVTFHGAVLDELMGVVMKEHDAAFDAFMTGVLFAIAQNELSLVGADFRRLRCITPIHGSAFSVMFEDEEKNCIVQPPSALIYLAQQRHGVLLRAESLRHCISYVTNNVSFLFNGDCCLITIGCRELSEDQKHEVNSVLESWCSSCSFTLSKLNLESFLDGKNIVYVSELVE